MFKIMVMFWKGINNPWKMFKTNVNIYERRLIIHVERPKIMVKVFERALINNPCRVSENYVEVYERALIIYVDSQKSYNFILSEWKTSIDLCYVDVAIDIIITIEFKCLKLITN